MKKLFCLGLVFWMSSLGAEEPVLAPEKLTTCIACHGEAGKSTNPAWPNLGGQKERYLLKRLQDYKTNKVGYSNPMTAIAATLSDKECQDLAHYYAQKPLVSGVTASQYLKRGQALYRGGDFEQKIAACIACHGPSGGGNGQAGFPALAGQNADYVIAQLAAFKEKKRTDDYNGIMRDISSRMSAEDMAAVAHYLQGMYAVSH